MMIGRAFRPQLETLAIPSIRLEPSVSMWDQFSVAVGAQEEKGEGGSSLLASCTEPRAPSSKNSTGHDHRRKDRKKEKGLEDGTL